MNIKTKEMLIGYLKESRISAEFTQKELAIRIGISRETINAIENLDPVAVNALKMSVVVRWWQKCQNYAPVDIKKAFSKLIRDTFKIQ